MVNVKPPARPVHQYGLWPPLNSKPYTVLDTDDWWKVAKSHNMDVWDLIDFNFKTRVPEEVNWYLRELVGCMVPSLDKNNYSFRGADRSKRKIYVPISLAFVPPPPSISPKTKLDKVIEDLWIESGNSQDDRQHRFECMLVTIQEGVDDRVILWNHIAPDHQTPAPAHLVRRRDRSISASATDPKWLNDNIKTKADVDNQPTGNGLGFGRFVTSLRKALEELQPNLLMFRGFHDQIIETHKTLENWANVQDGGSSSMPREYRAIKDWVAQQTTDPKSVLNCVIAAGRDVMRFAP
jgi:hypothetical protein